MDCKKVRDRFSSMWEGELPSAEEKVFKDHLFSCPMCQKEFERFEKTMRWLHSAGEVEVPEGFLPELYKKLKEEKRAVPGEKLGGKWFHLPISFRLPIQAGAMVVVVFLVLYLTKTIPMEGIRLKAPKQTSSTQSMREKPEGGLTSKVVKGEPRALELPPEKPHPKDVEQAKAPVPKEAQSEEASVPQINAEAKKREAPARTTEALGYQTVDSKEVARTNVPSPEPPKIERELAVPEKSRVASKPPQEIILRVSDRKKVIPLLHELVKQFGGEVVTTKGDEFLASVPTGSFREFEKELAGISPSFKADPLIAKKHAKGSLSLDEGAKRKEGDEKSKGPAKRAADTESQTIVRILVVED
jgi:Putative zinc-finger